jgi:chromosomal replication initiation ATPase DnaA
MNYYPKEVILKAGLLAGIPEVDIKYAITLLDNAFVVAAPYDTTPEGLLEDVCNIAGVTVLTVKSRKRDSTLVNVRVAFCKMCNEKFPEMSPKFVGKVISRDRVTVGFHYKKLLSNDPNIKEYYLRTRTLLAIRKRAVQGI